MNINLGTPYEAAIEKIIEKGYAGNQTEVIRQAIMAYERMIDEEEVKLVNKAIALEMDEVRAGKTKLYTHEQVKKKIGL